MFMDKAGQAVAVMSAQRLSTASFERTIWPNSEHNDGSNRNSSAGRWIGVGASKGHVSGMSTPGAKSTSQPNERQEESTSSIHEGGGRIQGRRPPPVSPPPPQPGEGHSGRDGSRRQSAIRDGHLEVEQQQQPQRRHHNRRSSAKTPGGRSRRTSALGSPAPGSEALLHAPPPPAPVSTSEFDKHDFLQAIPRFTSADLHPDPPPSASIVESLIACPHKGVSHQEEYLARIKAFLATDDPQPPHQQALPTRDHHLYFYWCNKPAPPPPQQQRAAFVADQEPGAAAEAEAPPEGSVATGSSSAEQSAQPSTQASSSEGQGSRPALAPPESSLKRRDTSASASSQPSSDRQTPRGGRPSLLLVKRHSNATSESRHGSSASATGSSSSSSSSSSATTTTRASRLASSAEKSKSLEESSPATVQPEASTSSSGGSEHEGATEAAAAGGPALDRRGSSCSTTSTNLPAVEEEEGSAAAVTTTVTAPDLPARTGKGKRAAVPEPPVFKPVLVRCFHFYGNDMGFSRRALEEVRIHRMAAHGRESLLDDRTAASTAEDSHAARRSTGSTRKSEADAAAAANKDVAQGGDGGAEGDKQQQEQQGERQGEGQEGGGGEPGPAQPGLFEDPRIQPVTRHWLEQQLFDPASKPAVGRHNIVPVLGHFLDLQPPGTARGLFDKGAVADVMQFRVQLGLALRFCEGGSLADRLGCQSRVAEREVMRWTEQVLGGLAHLHSLGILHRHIRPEAILLAPAGRYPDGLPVMNAKIADFSTAVEMEGHSCDNTAKVGGRLLRAHLTFLTANAPAWPAPPLAPEVRSLLVVPPSSSDPQPSYFVDPTGERPVTFRYLAGLDVWAAGSLAYSLMTHDVVSERPPPDLCLADTPVDRLLGLVHPRFDETFREPIRLTLAHDPWDRATAQDLLPAMLRVDKYLFVDRSATTATLASFMTASSSKSLHTDGGSPKSHSSRRTSPIRRRGAGRLRHKEEEEAEATSEESRTAASGQEGTEGQQPEAQAAPVPVDEKELLVQQQRALAWARYKAWRRKKWYQSLSQAQRQELRRRKEAKRTSFENLQRRRWLVDMATFRHWDPSRLAGWIEEAMKAAEAEGKLRDPVDRPSPAQEEEKEEAKEGQEQQDTTGKRRKKKRRRRKDRKRRKARVHEGEEGDEAQAGEQGPKAEEDAQAGPAGPTGAGDVLEEESVVPPGPDLWQMVYSERLHHLMVEREVTGKALEEAVEEAKRRALIICKEIARRAELEREQRERRGVMVKADYWDRVNIEKNLPIYAAKELAALPLFEPLFRKVVLMKDPELQPGENLEQLQERRRAMQAQLEADRQAMGEVVVRTYDALLPHREQGTLEACQVLTAFFRMIVVSNKMDRIWEDAEKQARRALVREERERVEALRAAFSNADYLTAEVFGVQSYSACLKLSSPVWRYLHEHCPSAGFTMGFRVSITHPNILVEIVDAPKWEEPQHTEHTKVLDLGPLHPETRYELQVVLPDTADLAFAALTADSEDAQLQLACLLEDLRTKTHALSFTTGPALRRPRPPCQLDASLVRASTVTTEEAAAAKPQGGAPLNQSLGHMLLGSSRACKKPAAAAVVGPCFFPVPVHAVTLTWAPPATNPGASDTNHPMRRRYVVQRRFRDAAGKHEAGEWVPVYRGRATESVDVIRAQDVRHYCTHAARRAKKSRADKKGRDKDSDDDDEEDEEEEKESGSEEEGKEEEEEGEEWEALSVWYRVSGSNEFGWSDFCSPVSVTLPLDGMLSGVLRPEQAEEEEEYDDEEELGLDPEDFPYELFGLDQDVLTRPEHFERTMRLPSISRRHKPPLAKQRPALSADGSVWHAFLPVDPAALARRRERLMRQRARLEQR